MNATCAVPGCGRPSPGALACHGCAQALLVELRRVPDLVDQLNAAISRQTSTGPSAGRNSEPSFPFAWNPASDLADLRDVLAIWCRDLAASRGLHLDVPRSPAPLARWLAGHIDHARAHLAAAQLIDELTNIIDECWRVVDRPTPGIFIGSCEHCRADLYGHPQCPTTTCPGCGHTHDAAQLWTSALTRLRLYPATAATIAAQAGELYGVRIDRKLINQWHHRGLIRPVDHDEHGDPRYRIGDVLDHAARTSRQAG